LRKGTIPITWKILENNDGGCIQLIYLGSTNATIFVDGIIEGGGKLKGVDSGITIKSPEDQMNSKSSERWIAILMAFSVFMASLFTIKDTKKIISNKKGTGLKRKISIFVPIILCVFMIIAVIIVIVVSFRTIDPPFGF
jgi:hypothetical protein